VSVSVSSEPVNTRQNDVPEVNTQNFGRVTDTSIDLPENKDVEVRDGELRATENSQPTILDLSVDDLTGPRSRRNQRISEAIQGSLSVDFPEAPLRSGVDSAVDTAGDAIGVQEDGSIAAFEPDSQRDSDTNSGSNTAAKGGLATAATLAVAAPEPVSTTTGAAVIGGLTLLGGATAASEIRDDDDVAQTNQDVSELEISDPPQETVELPISELEDTTSAELGTPDTTPGSETEGELGTPDTTPGSTDTNSEFDVPADDSGTAGVDEPIDAQQAINDGLLEENEEEEEENPFADRGRVDERRQEERNELARQGLEQTLYEQEQEYGEIERESVPTDNDPFSGEVPEDQTPEISGEGDPQTFGEREETFEERYNRLIQEQDEEGITLLQEQREALSGVVGTGTSEESATTGNIDIDSMLGGDTGTDTDTGASAGSRGRTDMLISVSETDASPDTSGESMVKEILSDALSETTEQTTRTNNEQNLLEQSTPAQLNENLFEFENPTQTNTANSTPITTTSVNTGRGGSTRRKLRPNLPELDDDTSGTEVTSDSDGDERRFIVEGLDLL
jgi:hypothetical protein